MTLCLPVFSVHSIGASVLMFGASVVKPGYAFCIYASCKWSCISPVLALCVFPCLSSTYLIRMTLCLAIWFTLCLAGVGQLLLARLANNQDTLLPAGVDSWSKRCSLHPCCCLRSNVDLNVDRKCLVSTHTSSPKVIDRWHVDSTL